MYLQALDSMAVAWDLAWAQALVTTAQVSAKQALAAAWVLTHQTTAQVGLVPLVLLDMLACCFGSIANSLVAGMSCLECRCNSLSINVSYRLAQKCVCLVQNDSCLCCNPCQLFLLHPVHTQ